MEDLPQVLEGIETRFLETPRLKIFTRFTPQVNDETIVFVHGNFTSGTYFEETMLAFGKEFYCVTPDLRGYGLTEDKVIDATKGCKEWADDLFELFNMLDLRKIHLVGWSLGGGVVMQFFVDHPDMVKSITLIDSISPFGFGDVSGLKIAGFQGNLENTAACAVGVRAALTAQGNYSYQLFLHLLVTVRQLI